MRYPAILVPCAAAVLFTASAAVTSAASPRHHNRATNKHHSKSTSQRHPTAWQRNHPIRLPMGWPKVLAIPKLRVSAHVEDVSFTHTNDIHAPFQWNDVAWFDKGVKPGDQGHAAIFGHLDSTCCPAVFYLISELHKGDIVNVAYKRGMLRFKVMWQAVYPNNKLPVNYLFGRSKQRGLVLITCTGIFHTDGSGYDHKRVVYARLLLPNGKIA